MASCFVCTALDLPCDIENHASYLQSWLGALKEDRRAIFRAAAAAQKAADWMLALHPDYARATTDADAGESNVRWRPGSGQADPAAMEAGKPPLDAFRWVAPEWAIGGRRGFTDLADCGQAPFARKAVAYGHPFTMILCLRGPRRHGRALAELRDPPCQ